MDCVKYELMKFQLAWSDYNNQLLLRFFRSLLDFLAFFIDFIFSNNRSLPSLLATAASRCERSMVLYMLPFVAASIPQTKLKASSMIVSSSIDDQDFRDMLTKRFFWRGDGGIVLVETTDGISPNSFANTYGSVSSLSVVLAASPPS